MIILWFVVPLLPIIAAIVIWSAANWQAYSNAPMLNALAAGVLVIVLLVPTIRQLDHHYGSAACYRYGAQVDREVRYLTNTFWDYGCYVRTDLGWVDRDKVAEFEIRGSQP